MPNIVYALTNAAMPGIVKIGMTDRDDIRRRMSDLYTTGVPLPFDCVVAREIDGREAGQTPGRLPEHSSLPPCRPGEPARTSPLQTSIAPNQPLEDS